MSYRCKVTLREILKFPKPKMGGPQHLAFLLAICPLACASAEQLIPIAEGTTWNYEMTQDVGGTLTLKPDAEEKGQLAVSYRIGGMQKIDNKDWLKLEMYRDDVLTSTDLITVDERGIICAARIDGKGALNKLDPPQTMIAMPLKSGASWDFDANIGKTKTRQRYSVTGKEDVDVPAGKFRAWRIRCEQTSPSAATIDRWLAPGTGIVKEITTMRAPTGDLLQRVSLELKEAPKIAAPPEAKAVAGAVAGKLSAGLSKGPLGNFTTAFASDTPKIYARWQGHGLREQSNIRVVWIAEKVEDIPPDYKIDEATATATATDSHGIFTLACPDDGWAPGDYRVEFYVDEALAETVRLKITK